MNILYMSTCRSTECISKPCQIDWTCNSRGVCTFNNTTSSLDRALIPQPVYNFTINRNKKALLAYVQNNSALYFKTYNFNQALKFAYNLCGRNKTGCCYKMLWRTHSGQRFINFKEQVNLWRYLIYHNRTSDLYYYIKTVLGSLRDLNVAKQMLGNNKFYPYQYLVKNRNVKSGCCQRGYNLLNYSDPTNGGKYINEYIRWLKSKKIFNPY